MITTRTEPVCFASPVVFAVEEAWAAIREHHPEVPPVYIVIASGHEGQRKAKRGHWAAGRWQWKAGEGAEGAEVGEAVGEVLLSGERIGEGAEAAFTTLLHEAAHGLAFAREVKDTSRGGSYHNKQYKKLAEELLLTVERGKHGYHVTESNDGVRTRYAAVIAALESALLLHRIAPAAEAEAKTRGISRITLECSCSPVRKLIMVPTQILLGWVTCDACNERFLDRSGKLAEWYEEQVEAGTDLKIGINVDELTKQEGD